MSRVSIMLPTYARNATGHLSAAISSVLAQTYRDFELIVVDDGSNDGSQQTIKDFSARDSRVKTRRFEQNIGLPALTTGLALSDATGEFIAWQFDDCVWEPFHLETLVRELDREKEIGIAYGQAVVGDADSEDRLGRALNIDHMLSGNNHIPNVSAVVRRCVYDDLGWVDPHVLLKRKNDWEMWARACRLVRFSFVEQVVAREGGTKLSDSLGNSVSINMPFALRYARLDRTETLRPANFSRSRPFHVPPELRATPEELASVGYLIVEHFIRVGRPEESFKHLDELGLRTPPWESAVQNGSSKLDQIYRWFVGTTVARSRAREIELASYVEDQRQILDARSAYIAAQEAEIHALRRRLRHRSPVGWLKMARDALMRKKFV